MKLDIRRVGAYIASFVITMLLATGIGVVVNRATVDNPLSVAYARLGFVNGFHLRKDGSKTQVIVEAGPVNDLRSAYQEVLARTANVIGNDSFELVFKDNRDEQLNALFDEISLYVHEGISTGRFSEMAEAVRSKSEALGVKSNLSVDSHNVYVALIRGERYLYEVIPREVGTGK